MRIKAHEKQNKLDKQVTEQKNKLKELIKGKNFFELKKWKKTIENNLKLKPKLGEELAETDKILKESGEMSNTTEQEKKSKKEEKEGKKGMKETEFNAKREETKKVEEKFGKVKKKKKKKGTKTEENNARKQEGKKGGE